MCKIKSVLFFFLLLFVLSSCENAKHLLTPSPVISETEPLTVMTYNVYVGGSTESILAVENLLQVPTEVANMYDNVIASNFPSRAVLIAKSIKAHNPHLIGLQEISLIRRQSPGDRITGGLVGAEEVVLDFLKILQDALVAEGLNYQVAAQVENIDVEMPMFTADGGIDDVRLTDYDVLLARSDVDISAPVGANYTEALTIEMLGLSVKRGYAAVDATVAGTTYRVVNTHLESFSEASRVAQTQELIESLAEETLPIILLGDFNTPAPDGTAYQKLIDAEYIDVWQMGSEGSGNTCCQAPDLLNQTSEHSQRIDQIFICNLAESITTSIVTQTVGDKLTDRTATGLWPSDHAGVVAQITLSKQ